VRILYRRLFAKKGVGRAKFGLLSLRNQTFKSSNLQIRDYHIVLVDVRSTFAIFVVYVSLSLQRFLTRERREHHMMKQLEDGIK